METALKIFIAAVFTTENNNHSHPETAQRSRGNRKNRQTDRQTDTDIEYICTVE